MSILEAALEQAWEETNRIFLGLLIEEFSLNLK